MPASETRPLPDLVKLRMLSQTLAFLLEDPSPELVIWQMGLYNVIEEIVKLLPPQGANHAREQVTTCPLGVNDMRTHWVGGDLLLAAQRRCNVQIIREHDGNCPLGVNGLRAYWEARDALSLTPIDALETQDDREALAAAEWELDQKQVCTCGVK